MSFNKGECITLLELLAAVLFAFPPDFCFAMVPSRIHSENNDRAAQAPRLSSGLAQMAQTARRTSSPPEKESLHFVLPREVASRDSNLKEGCWAMIHSATNFQGEALVLVGPATISGMTGPFGMNWENSIRSMETGRKATVIFYADTELRQQIAYIRPDQRLEEVSRNAGLFDQFAALKIECLE